jgi:hypothetical protein
MYCFLNDKEIAGEIRLWRACIKQHVIDLLSPPNKKTFNEARLFLFGKNELLPFICGLIDYDLFVLRRNVLKLYKQQKSSIRNKKIPKINEKFITKLAKDLLYA